MAQMCLCDLTLTQSLKQNRLFVVAQANALAYSVIEFSCCLLSFYVTTDYHGRARGTEPLIASFATHAEIANIAALPF